MTVQEAAEWGKTLDFPTVWAALMEDREQMKELRESIKELRDSQRETTLQMKETDRKMEETDRLFKETDRKMEETTLQMKETDRLFKETDRRIKATTQQLGDLGNSVGSLVEALFASHLGEKFDAYNYNLKRMYHHILIYDDDNRLRSEIDILLSNTTVCIAVEVKRWLETTKDVDHHIRRMQLIRQYPPAEVKGKKLLGAIVGAAVTTEAREYAEQNGFFVLELTGENVRLLEPPKDFVPKEW